MLQEHVRVPVFDRGGVADKEAYNTHAVASEWPVVHVTRYDSTIDPPVTGRVTI